MQFLDAPLFALSVYVFTRLTAGDPGLLGDERLRTFHLGLALLYCIVASLERFFLLRRLLRVKVGLVGLFLITSVILPTIQFINLRHGSPTPWDFVADSAPHLELSAQFLLSGKNPYATSRLGTELAKFPYEDAAGGHTNPALFHNDYPPGLFLLAALGQATTGRLMGFFDARLISLVFYLGLLWLGFLKFGMSEGFLFYLILVGANPIFNRWIILGANDIVVTAWIFAVFWFLEKKRSLAAAVILGIAAATKQQGWLAVPLVWLFVWKIDRNQLGRFMLISSTFALAFYLPFFLWNPKAFLEGQALYLAGALPTGYPVAGVGFSSMLVSLGVIPTIYTYYPVELWQGCAALIILGGFWWFIRDQKKVRVSALIMTYGILFTAVMFFNRQLYYSYLTNSLLFIAAGSLWDAPQAHSKPHLPLS